MPNHVMNRLEFDCSQERLKVILAAICYDEDSDVAEVTGPGTIDFNKIIPMPPSLNIESGSRTIDGINLYLTSLNPDVHHYGTEKMDHEAFHALLAKVGRQYGFSPMNSSLSREEIERCTQYTSAEELMEMGKIAVNNKLQYGATTWYEWRTRPDTWNTKWNSYYPGDYHGGSEITFQTAWDAPHPIIQKLSEMYPEVTIQHRWANEDYYQNCGCNTYRDGAIVDFDIPRGDKQNVEMAVEIWDTDLENEGLILNASGTDYINAEYPEYMVMELSGVRVLYSEEQLFQKDIPQGMHLYRLHKNPAGDQFVSIDSVANGKTDGGSIVSATPFDLGPTGTLNFNDEFHPEGTDEEISFGKYINQNQENREVINLG